MEDTQKYNIRLALRINRFFRYFINRANRKRLTNRDFSLLCNNCNGGIICHELGLQFRSPTVNLFFHDDHFFRFCENFDYYMGLPLTLCDNPIHKPSAVYPICNLGDLELHFMHYKSFEEAKELWKRRSARLNRNNIFVMWTFFNETDEALLERFEKLPFANKVAFTEMECSKYKSAFQIRDCGKRIGVLTTFIGLWGKRRIDQFDYVKWFNEGEGNT